MIRKLVSATQSTSFVLVPEEIKWSENMGGKALQAKLVLVPEEIKWSENLQFTCIFTFKF